MKKNVQTKKGFAALELLLVIGVVAGIIAGVFKLYQSIKTSNIQEKISAEISQVIAASEKYYGIKDVKPLDNVAIETTYINANIVAKWPVATAANVTTITPNGAYNSYTSYVNDLMEQKCDTYTAPAVIGEGNYGTCIILTH